MYRVILHWYSADIYSVSTCFLRLPTVAEETMFIPPPLWYLCCRCCYCDTGGICNYDIATTYCSTISYMMQGIDIHCLRITTSWYTYGSVLNFGLLWSTTGEPLLCVALYCLTFSQGFFDQLEPCFFLDVCDTCHTKDLLYSIDNSTGK